MRRKLLGLLAVGLLTGPMSTHASAITYEISAVASGTLGTATFTNALITFSADGDTSGIDNPSAGFFRNFRVTSFSIAGVGSGTVTDSTYWFANQNCGEGIGCAGVVSDSDGFSILYASSAAFLDYSLNGAIGPVTGPSTTLASLFAIDTTAGAMRITAPDFTVGPATFRASVMTVPEPGTFALLAFGLAGLGMYRRRRA